MELFRIIKSDARRAMSFCGGRAVASVLIAALSCLIITAAESVLLLIFCGTKALYSDLYTLAKTSPEDEIPFSKNSVILPATIVVLPWI